MLATLTYRLAVRAGVPLASLLLRKPAVRRGHRGRLEAVDRLETWARQHRDPARPLVWVHASSVGESLQARAVLTELRRLVPEFQAVATRFSASAERLAPTMPADCVEYVPYDRPADVRRVLQALQPSLLVFAKLDVWPELATQARAAGARLALIAGSVDPGSARLGWLARTIARRGYAALDLAAAISASDGERLARLGADPSRITVTGDPRIDAVLDGIDRTRADWPREADPHLLVAGSTWPADERLLLHALAAVRVTHPAARLLLVPHEPRPEHIATLHQSAKALGLTSAPWQRAQPTDAAVEIVDQMGFLAGLYSLGAVAYVGGGFGVRGIHSVLEPAGWGRPVIIGPRDRGVRDAALLESAGGLVRLPNTADAAALTRQWLRWLEEPATTARAGRDAGEALAADRGAARRSAELLAGLG